MSLRILSGCRHSAAGLTTASSTLVALLALGAPSSAAAPKPAFTYTSPAAPVQTFNVRAQTVQANGVTFNARPDKIAFKYFASVPPAVGVTRDIALGRDGNLWISTDCVGAIERLTPKGVATAYTYGTPSQCDTSTSITPGPDGNLWFVDEFANIVGKISTKGKITKYPLPVATPCNYLPSAPIGIVAGPDGAMWFTVTYPGNPFCSASPGYAPAVGRITTNGAMTFYYTGAPGTTNDPSPERITAGPDGNLYFIVFGAGSQQFGVGKITTGGFISYVSAFSTDAPNFEDYLTFGSDGNLWVTDTFGHNIFRIASNGITAFAVGTYNGVQEAAYGITTGPDGQLWFTTFDANVLGRITTAGAITLYPTPSCSPASACGSGGGIVRRAKAVWYTLPGNHEDEDVVEASRLP